MAEAVKNQDILRLVPAAGEERDGKGREILHRDDSSKIDKLLHNITNIL